MKHYTKPSLTVAHFTTQETIANALYEQVGTTTENYVDVPVPVTSYDIHSFAASSN